MDNPDKMSTVAPMSLLNKVSVENGYSVWLCDQ